MSLSNDGLVAFHCKSYGTFFILKRPYNLSGEFTHYRNYRAQHYLTPLKKSPDLYIGIELEFPIVCLNGPATDTAVCKALLTYLAARADFMVEQVDWLGDPVQIRQKDTGDVLLFEVSYSILEFAFAKSSTIGEVEVRFESYLDLVQAFLRERGHELQGLGIHPQWANNANSPVQLPRYQMLMDYLSLGKTRADCHEFVDYGAFICGNQVQLDVSRANYLRVLNAFNQIEAAKAYLFANSSFPEGPWDTRLARDYFWEQSMHGLIAENVGVFPQEFADDQAYLEYLTKTAMFTVTRGEETLYFSPQRVSDYLKLKQLPAYRDPQTSLILTPQLSDLATHRAYHYQLLTRRGTVEFRSVCTQPLARTFAPTAFHLGLLGQIAELEGYLASADFFAAYGRDYPALRKRFAKPALTTKEEEGICQFAKDLVSLAFKGLRARGFGEESYLIELAQDLSLM